MGLVPTWREKLHDERVKLKSLKGKELWEYIWEYYKVLIFGTLIFLVVLGSIINSILNPPPTAALSIAWLYGPQLTEFFDELEHEITYGLDLDTDKERVELFQMFITDDPQMNMAMQSRFAAMLAVGELDVMIGTREDIKIYAYQEALLELSRWFSGNEEGFLWTERMDGVTGLFGISLQNSIISEHPLFFAHPDYPIPYFGVFITTGREENIRKAIDLLLN